MSARGPASIGALLLCLYFLANPPLLGSARTVPAEGSYLFVDKVLVEMVAMLVVLAFPTGHIVGLDRLKLWERSKDE